MTKTNVKTALKQRIGALQQEREELNKTLPQVETDYAHYERLVNAGRRDGGRVGVNGPNANPGAVSMLAKLETTLRRQRDRLRDTGKELEVLEAQLNADTVKSRCRGEMDRLDGEMSELKSEVDSLNRRSSELDAQREVAQTATREAEDALAVALADGKELADCGELDAEAGQQARRARSLATAIEKLSAKVGELRGRSAALRQQKQRLQDEADLAELHAAQADWDAFAPTELMPRLRRLVTAQRRAYGHEAVDFPELKHEYREWLQAQLQAEEADAESVEA